MTNIETLVPDEVLDADVPKSVIERAQRFEDALRTIQVISGMAGNELAVVSSEAQDIEHSAAIHVISDHLDTQGMISSAAFEPKPKLLSGAADSAHSVMVGELSVGFGESAEEQIEVAAKCYSKRTPSECFERAMREIEISEHMSSVGEIYVEPIALAIAPDGFEADVIVDVTNQLIAEGDEELVLHATNGEIVLLTRYNPLLTTLDNLPWGRGAEGPGNLENAIHASQALGRFNAVHGYRHGDAKIKNIADVPGCKTGMIDFETSTKLDLNDPMEVRAAVSSDFGLLITSLEKRGFIARNGYRENRIAINEMADAYIDQWTGSTAHIQDAVMDEIANWIEVFDPVHIDRLN